MVTLLEIAAPDQGGVWEKALPGERSSAPPSPPEERRIWVRSFRRRALYLLVGVALALIVAVVLLQAWRMG